MSIVQEFSYLSIPKNSVNDSLIHPGSSLLENATFLVKASEILFGTKVLKEA